MAKNSEIKVSGSRASGRDCLIHQESANEFLLGVARHEITEREDVAALEATSRESLAIAYGYDDSEPEGPAKPFVYKDGIAVIPVHGTLLNRFNGSWGFVTGYNYIRRQMNLALFDDDVEMIVFDIDSPGGEAAGNFELCREIMEAREDKPILAVVDSRCMSGGYSIGASCTQMMAIPSAAVGSIGVYRMHMDISKMMDQQGVKVTFAKAGDHKTDGNPFEPLSDSVRREWEESAGKTWDDFISVVAEGRGLTIEEVRATQAKVYRSDEALAIGLIDAVKTPSEAVAAFVAQLAQDEPFSEDDEMAVTPKTQAEVASAPVIDSQAIADAVANDRRNQRQRRSSILALDEAKDRPALARSLADDTEISVDEAKVVLMASAADKVEAEEKPAAKPAEGDEGEGDEGEGGDDGDDADGEEAKGKGKGDQANHFANAMGGGNHPNIGAGSESGGKSGSGEPTDSELAAGILSAHSLATGRKSKAA